MSTSSQTLVRISKIAARYLVFDSDDVAALRRQANTNGTLVGTSPQQPTQNIFLGLPIELRPEEVESLLERGLAYLIENVDAHELSLKSLSLDTKKAYVDSLRRRKQAAYRVFFEMNANKISLKTEHAKINKGVRGSRVASTHPNKNIEDLDVGHKLEVSSQVATQVSTLSVTPTSSKYLIDPAVTRTFELTDEGVNSALCHHLQRGGYYLTPGLRFGAQFSVYPGDPLRFHAHFMSTQYEWDEDIPILDIVAGGRLATAVKKAFLIGGREHPTGEFDHARVRTFSIEWAGM